MWRSIRSLLFCAALGGCSTAGGVPPLTSIGGGNSSDMPPKAAMAPEAASSQSSNSGNIWANFSSAFSSGDQPAQAPQKNSDDAARASAYAQAGIWYDALDAISNAIEANPNDASLKEQRAALLKQVGLSQAAALDQKK